MVNSDSGRVVALRRPDGATRHPYQKSGRKNSPKPPVKASWKFIGFRSALPVVEAKGENGPVGYWIESYGVFTPLQLA
jgi:hypothetical protein